MNAAISHFSSPNSNSAVHWSLPHQAPPPSYCSLRYYFVHFAVSNTHAYVSVHNPNYKVQYNSLILARSTTWLRGRPTLVSPDVHPLSFIKQWLHSIPHTFSTLWPAAWFSRQIYKSAWCQPMSIVTRRCIPAKRTTRALPLGQSSQPSRWCRALLSQRHLLTTDGSSGITLPLQSWMCKRLISFTSDLGACPLRR